MYSIAFSQNAYDEFDQKGKQAVINFFVSYGYTYCENDEDRGIDLKFIKMRYSDVYVEVAVRYKFDWNLREWDKFAPWKTIHILKRKAKYGKSEPQWYGNKAYLFELNRDLSQALVIRPCDLQEKHLKLMKNVRGMEQMYDVPVECFKIYDL